MHNILTSLIIYVFQSILEAYEPCCLDLSCKITCLDSHQEAIFSLHKTEVFTNGENTIKYLTGGFPYVLHPRLP